MSRGVETSCRCRLFAIALIAIVLTFASCAFAAPPAHLIVTPTSLQFSYTQGGANPASQTLSVTSSSTQTSVSYSVTKSNAAWLSLSSTQGTTPGTVTVSVNPAGLAAGSYSGSVTVSSRKSTITVPVSLTVISSTPKLAASPTSLSFAYTQGGALPGSQSISLTNSASSAAISYTDSTSGGSWLSVDRTSGSTPSSISVSVQPSGMAAGTYNGSVSVTSSAGNITVPVTLTVTATARLSVSPSSLTFNYTQGGALPPAQSLSVTSTISGTNISYTDSASGGSWLAVGSSSGTTPGSISVYVQPGTISAGTYNASVVISSSTGNVTVPVTLNVTSSSGGGGTSGSYVMLAWAELGMHCMDGKDYSVFSVLPPYNTVYAKLLTKAGQPLPVTSGVTVTYAAVADSTGSINTTSSGTSTVASKTNFWNYVRMLFLGQPAPDVGLHNYPVQSRTPQQMTFDTTKGLWKAEGVPTVPYDDAGASKAYPMVQIVAKDTNGNTLATTTTVLAVSDEMSCKNCHAPNTNSAAMPSGGWITQYTTAQNIKLNILKKHDDAHPIPAAVLAAVQANEYPGYQSSLYQTALNNGNFGNPVLCAACHQSNALNAAGMNTGVKDSSGKPLVPALTSSMHSMHASVTLPGSTTTLDNATDPANSCYQCHPGVVTKCQRGVMSNTACYNCHGNLSRVGMETRAGWLDEPNCQMCHQNSQQYTSTFTSTNLGPTGTQRSATDLTFATNPNVPAQGFSLYRFSQGHGGMECSSCHNAQHAEYPTNQANDNVASIALQGYQGRLTECASCHGTSLATTGNGGPHGMHTVGQAWVTSHASYAQANLSACAYCHGSTYRGSALSQILTNKSFNAGEYGTKSFTAGHQMSCYDCHNGPNGG